MTEKSTSKGSAVTVALAVVALSALIGFAAVYVTLGGSDNVGAPNKVEKAERGSKRGHAKRGDLSAFVKKSPPAPIADVAFMDGSGAPKKLSDFQGKVVLLNLWATWCAPCKAEMPSLDRLQQNLGSDDFEVVALALDRKGRAVAQKFLDDLNIKALTLYIDETAKVGAPLGVVGMPVTILIDREGKELGRLVGEAEWDSEAAITLIKQALAQT